MSLFAEYPVGSQRGGYDGAYDEMFADAAAQTPRPHYQALFERLSALSADEFKRRVALSDSTLVNQGITFTLYGDAVDTERTIPVDLIPRILPSNEWDHIERGLTQRITALNLFLQDLYCGGASGPKILADKIVPREIIENAAHYRREFVGTCVPRNIHVHICGTDLIRGNDGDWYVLEDNLRTPSGVSYVLENRRILARVFPQVFGAHPVRPVDHYTTRLLDNLRALSSRPVDDPTVVLLTPGVYNSAYFEHAFLAQQMGIQLVQGSDLFVDEERVFMKTTSGPQRVDVIYRRIDDDFLDPEVFRPDSMLGAPGLMRAYAAGNVALANTVGTGIADDKVIYKYVPEIIRYYLGEEAILPNVPTWCAWDERDRAHILGNLDRLVVKAANESGGYGMLIGPQASPSERAAFADKIRENPRNYLAQPLIELSTAPTFVDGVGIEPRRVDLRPYILCGPDGVTIIPGGLTRVALVRGSYVVNSSQGGGSKDTWVLDTAAAPHWRQSQSQSQSQTGGGRQTQSQSQSVGQSQNQSRTWSARQEDPAMLSREADALFWMGRYLERAEATARLVDVQYHAALESSWLHREPESLWSSILEITGDERIFRARHGEPTERDLIDFMVFDLDQPDSIVSCIRAARANAQSVREVISSEMWEALNRSFLDILHWDVDRMLGASPHSFLVDVRNGCHLFFGLTQRTLLVGDALHFLRAGIFLERADQISRLTDVLVRGLTGGDYVLDEDEYFDTHGWIACLRSASAFEAFRKTYRGGITPEDVLAFLVLDWESPSSIHHAVSEVERSLRSISGSHGRRYSNDAERLAGQLHADLSFLTVPEMRAGNGLHAFLSGIQRRCSEIGDAVARTYLRY